MRLFIAATTVLSLIGASQALPAVSNACQETHKGMSCHINHVKLKSNLNISI